MHVVDFKLQNVCAIHEGGESIGKLKSESQLSASGRGGRHLPSRDKNEGEHRSENQHKPQELLTQHLVYYLVKMKSAYPRACL